jgi:threonine dehydratase
LRDVVDLDSVREARLHLEGVAIRTPMFDSQTFSAATGTRVFLKAENLQKTGSFKIRGALNRLSRLTEGERRAGVVVASAGNHGQGVGLAARKLGVPVTVYMPVNAPLAKQQATEGYGAQVILEGESYDDAQAAAKRDAGERPYIPAFDDEDVVAGQGTVGLEILEDVPDPDVILVPLGGGGLLAGVATVIKALRPGCRLVGVQAAGCSTFAGSLERGEPQAVERAQTIADGIAVKRPGEVTFPIVQRLADDVVAVDDAAICQAIVALLERAKLVVEGAGAVGLAALLGGRVAGPGETVVVVLSGGNLDAVLLQAVVRFGLTTGGRYLVVRSKIPDRPGQLMALLGLLARDRVNVLGVEHHREGMDVGVREVEVELTLETRDDDHCAEILARLSEWGYAAERVT